MNQEERLDYLIDAFGQEVQGKLRLPETGDTYEKRRLLRSLMNIRMPGRMSNEVLSVQDSYLKERIRENGVVRWNELPSVKEQGSTLIHGDRISLWQGDITTIEADAIVNAANAQMLGCFVPMHACIDNCIHTFAGIQLRLECAEQMKKLRMQFGEDYEQPTAVPMLTEGYNLPAHHVIHIVGPIVSGSLTHKDETDLENCYRRTLDFCKANDLRSVVFCCISTGVFCFPNDRAAEIAVKTVTAWMDEYPEAMDRVIFNVFKDQDKKLYEKELLLKAVE